MATPDESDDVARADDADRRDNRRGAIVAGAGILVVALVGGFISLEAANQPHAVGIVNSSQPAGVELPTYALPDSPGTPSPLPTNNPSPRPTKTKHLSGHH